MTPDLHYTLDGLFIRFYANTDAGEQAWRVMAAESRNACFYAFQAKAILKQLKDAGYTVRKIKPKAVTQSEIDEILKELGE